MWLYDWKPLTVSHHVAMFGEACSIAKRDITNLICQMTSQNQWSKGHVASWVRDSYGKSPHCQVLCQVFSGWRTTFHMLAYFRPYYFLWSSSHFMLTHTKFYNKHSWTKTFANLSYKTSLILVTRVPGNKWGNIYKKL